MKTVDQVLPGIRGEFAGRKPMRRAVIALAAALALAAFAIPAQAQVSGPHVGPNGQETYPGGDTTDPDFSPYTSERQRWDRNNLDTDGIGQGYVGSLARYQVQARVHGANRLEINLGWTPPSAHAGSVSSVSYKVMGGRRPGSQPVRIVPSCPGGFSDNVYEGISPVGNHDLNGRVNLAKCNKALRFDLPGDSKS